MENTDTTVTSLCNGSGSCRITYNFIVFNTVNMGEFVFKPDGTLCHNEEMIKTHLSISCLQENLQPEFFERGTKQHFRINDYVTNLRIF